MSYQQNLIKRNNNTVVPLKLDSEIMNLKYSNYENESQQNIKRQENQKGDQQKRGTMDEGFLKSRQEQDIDLVQIQSQTLNSQTNVAYNSSQTPKNFKQQGNNKKEILHGSFGKSQSQDLFSKRKITMAQSQAQKNSHHLAVILGAKYRIIHQAILNSISFRKRKMPVRCFQIFNDKTISLQDFGIKEKNSFSLKKMIMCILTFFLSKCEKIFPKFFNQVLHPRNKLIFDVIKLLVVLGAFLFVPYYLALPDGIDLKYYTVIFGSVLVADLFLQLNTGFFQMGKFITNRKKIIKKYIKDNFIFDFLSLVGIILTHVFHQENEETLFQQSDLFLLLVFTQIRFQLIMKGKLQEIFMHSQTFNYIYDLCQLVFLIFSYCHFFSCVWVYFARQERENGLSTWADEISQGDKFGNTEYIYGFYFSMITMSSVGYGDISPVNTNEAILCIFFVFLSSCMFGYSLSSIASIIEGIKSRNKTKEMMLIQINKYMKNKNISQSLQYNIREYTEYYYSNNFGQKKEIEQKIYQIIPESLRFELKMESFNVALQDSPIIRTNFSEDVLKKTVDIVKEVHLNPGQVVYKRGEQGSNNIYFILKGEFAIELDDQKEHQQLINGSKEQKKLIKLEPGQVFGEQEFFTGQERRETIKSKDFSICLMIRREDFLLVLNQSKDPKDYERFCQIKDTLIFQNNSTFLEKACLCCKSLLHSYLRCPYGQMIFNKSQIIGRHNYTKTQERNDFNKILTSNRNNAIFKREYKGLRTKGIKYSWKVKKSMIEFRKREIELLWDIRFQWRINHFGEDNENIQETIEAEENEETIDRETFETQQEEEERKITAIQIQLGQKKSSNQITNLNKKQKNQQQQFSLPIKKHSNEILETIEDNQLIESQDKTPQNNRRDQNQINEPSSFKQLAQKFQNKIESDPEINKKVNDQQREMLKNLLSLTSGQNTPSKKQNSLHNQDLHESNVFENEKLYDNSLNDISMISVEEVPEKLKTNPTKQNKNLQKQFKNLPNKNLKLRKSFSLTTQTQINPIVPKLNTKHFNEVIHSTLINKNQTLQNQLALQQQQQLQLLNDNSFCFNNKEIFDKLQYNGFKYYQPQGNFPIVIRRLQNYLLKIYEKQIFKEKSIESQQNSQIK